MSIMTNKYGLFKYDTVNDGLQKFNINTALNDNWDKVETAINTAKSELNESINTVNTNLSAAISSGDSTTLGSAKSYTDSVAATTLTSANNHADVVAENVKNDLLNGAGAAYDTLKELADLIDVNTDAIDALETVAASKVSQTDFNSHTTNKSNPHAVTAAQVGAPTIAEMNAAIAAIPTPDVSGQISTHNSNTAAHSDIRALIQALKPRITTVSLAAGSWSGSAAPFTQSVTVSGILADATKQVINVAPTATSANIEAISTAGVYATAQGANTITFSAMNSKPTVTVSFIVQFQDAVTI